MRLTSTATKRIFEISRSCHTARPPHRPMWSASERRSRASFRQLLNSDYLIRSRWMFTTRDHCAEYNHLTIRRDEVEARVLSALQDKLLRQDLFEEFCQEFTREMNRLRMEHRAGLSAAEREIERIETRRKKLVDSIMEGVPASEVKDELSANATRREELKAKLAAADAPPPLLHPEMAGLYRQKVTALAEALEHPETRTEASEALRGLIDAIVLTPNQGELQIELKGNLAAMLGAAQNAKRSPETGDLSLQVVMVAGARNQQHLQLWSGRRVDA